MTNLHFYDIMSVKVALILNERHDNIMEPRARFTMEVIRSERVVEKIVYENLGIDGLCAIEDWEQIFRNILAHQGFCQDTIESVFADSVLDRKFCNGFDCKLRARCKHYTDRIDGNKRVETESDCDSFQEKEA